MYMTCCLVLRFNDRRHACPASVNPSGDPLFLRLEFCDERSEMRRHRGRESVVLLLERLSDCQKPNPSTANGIRLAFRGMGSVAVVKYVPANPIVDPKQADDRLTLGQRASWRPGRATSLLLLHAD